MNISNKILIIGCVGSGKSTYSKRLARKLKIKRYEIDEIVHDDFVGRRRTNEEQDAIIKEIDKNDSWIIEGSMRNNLLYLLDLAETIIFMDTSKEIIEHRVVTRYIRQCLNIEKIKYEVNYEYLEQMLKWVDEFFVNKEDYLKVLNKYKNKVIIKRTI